MSLPRPVLRRTLPTGEDALPDGLVTEIERIIEIEFGSTPQQTIYDSVFESPLMFPLQRREEVRKMLEIARTTSPKVVMEIGTDKGGGAYHWLKALEPEQFIGIEIRGVPYDEAFRFGFPGTDQLWIEASSYDHTTVAYVQQWLSERKIQIDVLFIDGDKSHFATDYYQYVPMVRKGGIIFMHDIRDRPPLAAFNEAKRHDRVRNAITFESTLEVATSVMNEVAGIPTKNEHENWLRHWRGASAGVGVLWV